MKHYFKRLAALITLSLTHNTSSVAAQNEMETDLIVDDPIRVADLNVSVSKMLAAHRSHSSHRSHRSSSSGGYRAPTNPNPSHSNTPSIRRNNTGNRTADPLGQQARPLSSYPSTQPKTKLPIDKESLRNIIMRVQLTLKFDNYYHGDIDGTMGPETREAVRKFKEANGITGKAVLDAKTLNALGIKGF